MAGLPTGAEDAPVIGRLRPDNYALGQSPAFREKVRRLHRLGPRATGEFIACLITRLPETAGTSLELLDRYAGINPRLLEAYGGRDWLGRRDLIRAVGGRT